MKEQVIIQACHKKDCTNFRLRKWRGEWIDKWFCEEHEKRDCDKSCRGESD